MNAVEYCLLHGLKTSGPAHPALVSAAETLSYGALAARVAKFAAALRESGVKAGDRVAMVMLDTPDIVAMHQAAMATGAIAAALSNRASVEELALILSIVRPHTLAADEEFIETVAKAASVASPETKLITRQKELRGWKDRPETDIKITPRAPNDPAFWVMTSGTTGTPKAVEHRHGNVGISGDYYAQILDTTKADRLFATSRFHFAYAIGNQFAALRLGATNILLENWATAGGVAEAVARHKPTILLSVPALYHKMIDAGLPGTPQFRALRHYVSAGERLPPKIWNDWEAAGGFPILDGLGCSELVYMVIGNTPTIRRPGSSGVAMPGVELRIVDENDAIISAPGQTGRLEVRMSSVCVGYRAADSKRDEPPQRPAERFKPEGWFATGDEYIRDAEGFYHHRGRSGDMLRVSGIWVSPSEIEDLLAGTPGITETAAVLGENAIGLAEIALFVVLAPGADGGQAVSAARARLAGVLPHYKMPRRFEIVADLPRTATGKVQRHKLRERLHGEPR
jgi:benzoate-CoA ligase